MLPLTLLLLLPIFIALTSFPFTSTLPHDNTNINLPISPLLNFTSTIIPIPNINSTKTRCITKKRLFINDTLFQYPLSSVLSSKQCSLSFPKDIDDFISYYTDNIYIKHKIILTICFINHITSPQSSPLSAYLSSINLTTYKYSSLYWNEKDIDDYLITGTSRELELNEYTTLKTIYFDLTTNLTLNLKTDKYFTSIYNYITQHSIVLFDNTDIYSYDIVLFPYLDTCSVFPHDMVFKKQLMSSHKETEYKNDTISFELVNDTLYIIKANRNYNINSHFYYVMNNNTLSNTQLLLREGKLIKDNYYNSLYLKHKINFTSIDEFDKFKELLNKKGVNASNVVYNVKSFGNGIEVEFNINVQEDVKQMELFKFFGVAQEQFGGKNNKKNRKVFIDEVIQISLRIIAFFKSTSDNIIRLFGNDINTYINETLTMQENNNLKEMMIHLYNLENLYTIHKFHNNYYANVMGLLWRNVRKYQPRYANL